MHYLIVGLANSGMSATRLLYDKSYQVTVTDTLSVEELGDKGDEIKNSNIPFVSEGQACHNITNFDVVVKSPGVPMTNPIITQASAYEIPVIDELELGFQFLDESINIIAVTGTNGKTTTTSLIGEMLTNANIPNQVGGNIGVPLSTLVNQLEGEEWIVLEVSSSQLENIISFNSDIAVILNITPDHLDWHGSFENYYRAKSNVFSNQSPSQVAVLNEDDGNVRELIDKVPGQLRTFSLRKDTKASLRFHDDKLMINQGNTSITIIRKSQITLTGSHNLENIMAAVTVAVELNISPEVINHTLREFKGVAHRLEFVRDYQGVKFINDSKGTNIEAALKAVSSFNDLILIAGGKDKGAEFDEFAKVVSDKAKAVVLLGETKEDISESLQKYNFGQIYYVESLKMAVKKAHDLAVEGDVVLLSPACASWDMFNSFEERGDLFKQQVLSLGSE